MKVVKSSEYLNGMANMQSGDFEQALLSMMKSYEAGGHLASSAEYEIANCYRHLGRYQDAIDWIVKTEQHNYFWAAMNLKGICHIHLMEYDQARSCFESLIEKDFVSSSTWVLINLCFCNVKLGNMKMAQRILDIPMIQSYVEIDYRDPRSALCRAIYDEILELCQNEEWIAKKGYPVLFEGMTKMMQ